MDYTKYNVEDFAGNESFIEWVHKSNPASVKFWDLYISQNPEIRLKTEQARTLVLNLKRSQDIGTNKVILDSIWDKIELRTEAQPKQTQQLFLYSAFKVALASAAVVFIALAFWFLVQEVSIKNKDLYVYQNTSQGYAEQINNTGKPLDIKLVDGSIVTLENKSRLKYKGNYKNDSTRHVYLIGRAFFKVAKNPDKPFIVHSNEVLTKVLGTSFTVDAPENGDNIIVSVNTGKVSVYTSKENSELTNNKKKVILLPNQRVEFARAEQLFNKTLVDEPRVLDPQITEKNFKFDNTPIAEVFKTMESAYGIDIIFDDAVMKKCFLTAPLGFEPLTEKMKIICETIGATYKIVDAKLVVTSTGC